MLLQTLKNPACAFAAIAALTLAVTSAHSQGAAKSNVFSKFGGNWSGSGLIYLSNGTKERIRCRGGFVTGDAFSMASLKLEIRCANETFNFELQGEFNHDRGAVTGSWSEVTRNVHGKVNGTIKDDQIQALAESANFTATLELINLGDKQQIRITSPGSEMTDVLIGLNRLGVKPQQATPVQPPNQ